MINAEEARSKTILGEARYQKKLYISTVKKINRKIKEATKKGSYGVACERDHISDDVCKLLITHYENLGLVLTLLNIAVAARNADHLNTNVSGNVIVKAEDEKEMLKNN